MASNKEKNEKITEKDISEINILEVETAKPEFSLPNYNEIPGVGLFLEQVSKYISEYTGDLAGELTGSMISNYVKKGIIDNPVKKQYGREQIAYLIFISIAKLTLSLEDINTLMMLQKSVCDVEKAYVYFQNEFTSILNALFEGRELPPLDESDDDNKKKVKTIARNLSISVAHKIYLDKTLAAIKEARKI